MPSWLKVVVLEAMVYCLVILAKKIFWKDEVPSIVSNLRVFIAFGIGFIAFLVFTRILDDFGISSIIANITLIIITIALIILISKSLEDRSKGKLWNKNWAFFCWNIIGVTLIAYFCFTMIPIETVGLKSFKMTLPLSTYIWFFSILLLWTIFLVFKEFNKNKKLCLMINIATFIVFYGIIVIVLFLPVPQIAHIK